MNLSFEIQKTNFAIRIYILEILCVPIFRQSPKTCPKIRFWFEIQKTNVEITISILQIPCEPIFGQNDNFDFFGQNLPKREFRVGNS